jgi:hypothetical protein
MVVDHFIDMQDDAGRLWLRGWRCMTCGEIVDPVIYRHRLIQNSLRVRRAEVAAEKRAREAQEEIRLSA